MSKARGGRPPLPEPHLLSGTFGAPAAHRFAPEREASGVRKTGSHTRAEPLLTATSISCLGGVCQ
jgi:hypothetical protein